MIHTLPEELRTLVLSLCDSCTVLNLCLASKILSLYRTIDLDTHNQQLWKQHDIYTNADVPADHARAIITDEDELLLDRQSKLMHLFSQRPELGQEVRELQWTMINVDASSPFRNRRDAFNFGSDQLWNTFACCSKVTTVDIAFLTTYRELDMPPPLFPMATSISLAGIASHAVLSSILTSIDPTKLKHLRLNNLQTFADTDGMLAPLSDTEIDAHRRRRAGGAYGWLTILTGRCPSLRTFHFITAAEFVDQSNDMWASDWPTQIADVLVIMSYPLQRSGVVQVMTSLLERHRYAELGNFINSIKPHIRELLFEHGPDIQYFGYNPGKHTVRAFQGPNHDTFLPMDIFFNTYILPALSSGPWPRLQKMTLRGIGHWKPLDLWSENTKAEEFHYLHRKTLDFRDRAESIWDAVGGKKTDVCIEAEASKPFYRFQDDRTR